MPMVIGQTPLQEEDLLKKSDLKYPMKGAYVKQVITEELLS
jgi:hypothetical protein